jgi:hypothetical protein
MLSNRITAVAAGSVLVVGLGASGAVAGNLIGSSDIRDGGVHRVDLDNKATGKQVNGLVGQVNALESELAGSESDVTSLEDRIAALEGAAATGADINTNWEDGLGATIVDANTTVLDSRSDEGYAYSTIRNLDLPINKGAVIEFTYKLENGAEANWGAPRVQIRVNGVTYSSAHQINPDYGVENADGTFTVTAVATSMNDNSATQVPEGPITRASLVYDYVAKGTVTFTHLVIDGQPISFQ